MNSNGLKKVILKIVHAIILMTIKIENFDFDNLLIDKKKLIQNYFGFWRFTQNFVWFKTIAIRLDKVDGLMVIL